MEISISANKSGCIKYLFSSNAKAHEFSETVNILSRATYPGAPSYGG